jgi:hypothetical protein
MEGHPVPAVVETRPEATAATPQWEIAAAEARSEAAVETQQEPALAGSSRAVVVIPDDDSPPPGWDQWVNFPMPSPESREGALVRWWDGHMVAGGQGTAPRLLLPAPAALLRERGASTSRPPSPALKRSSNCERSSVTTAPCSTGR